MRLTPEVRLTKNPDIQWKMIEEEAVLVDQDELQILHLNEVATEVWNLIDGKRTVNEIITQMLSVFEVKRKTAEKDILDFLQKLIKIEAITNIKEVIL
ncbi:MAG: PqqD family protein [Thermodesulfobacteriota bacterium]